MGGSSKRGSYIMKTVFALAALAAIGFAGTAFAGQVAIGTWSAATATAPKAMSDSDMDKVTAGLTVYGSNVNGGQTPAAILPALPEKAFSGGNGNTFSDGQASPRNATP